ncbi:ECF transporter S component [uncultured Neglectibacter sp.]|uniref:ECF transporter S component n=1 Tax=uncultured Neglectibacter sp. TaxID=1924108 RepID=UPI0034DF6859
MTKTKKYIWEMVVSALCVALGIVLPVAVHGIPNAGSILLPMHIPVLLCGLLCGPAYGIACGILTPLLSSLITSMPPMAMLPSMICELAVYGFAAGLLILVIRTGSQVANVYISLIGAMLVGRVVYGVVNALIFRAGEYSMQMWLTASFVTALPGIIIQLVLLPLVVLALRKARLAFQP